MKRGRRHRWNALSPARWYEMPSASIFLRSASCFSLSKTNCIRDASCSALNFSVDGLLQALYLAGLDRQPMDAHERIDEMQPRRQRIRAHFSEKIAPADWPGRA